MVQSYEKGTMVRKDTKLRKRHEQGTKLRKVTSLMVLELTVKNRPSPRHLFLVRTLAPLELTELRSGP
jgi:hypothetical protein